LKQLYKLIWMAKYNH